MRGSGGPVHVTPDTFVYPLSERLVKAGEEVRALMLDWPEEVEV